MRAVGLMQTTDDIAATVVKVESGTPVRVRDLAMVVQAPKVGWASSEKPSDMRMALSSTMTTWWKASFCCARAPKPTRRSMRCTRRLPN